MLSRVRTQLKERGAQEHSKFRDSFRRFASQRRGRKTLTGVGGGGSGSAQVEGGGVADGLAAEAGVAPVGGSVAESTGIAGTGARHLAASGPLFVSTWNYEVSEKREAFTG